MANKQLIGTGLYVTDTNITLKIPVQQSYLPVQQIKGPVQDLPKEMVYSNDSRNLHFELSLQCSDGKTQSEHKIELGKESMTKFFHQIQKIQDEINSYL